MDFSEPENWGILEVKELTFLSLKIGGFLRSKMDFSESQNWVILEVKLDFLVSLYRRNQDYRVVSETFFHISTPEMDRGTTVFYTCVGME